VKNNLLRLEIESKSVEFRSKNGYGTTDPIRLSSLLLKNNVITLFKPLSENLAGMAIKATEEFRFMMVNQNHVLGKQHFTIGHELYHLFIQEQFTSQKCNTGLYEKQTDMEERKADFFAACLLLPESGVMQLIPEGELIKRGLISTETIFKIQHYYSISFKSVIYRLCELDLIDKSYFDKYSSGIKNMAKNFGLDLSLYEKGNFDKIIGDYGGLANRLFNQKKISESFYFELLNAINIDPLATEENDEEH
jgi:Zn-dependent peptidase ImmA (M78 family)